MAGTRVGSHQVCPHGLAVVDPPGHIHVWHPWSMGVSVTEIGISGAGVPYEVRLCRCGEAKIIEYPPGEDPQ